ncbi:MAG: hypothetical protein ACK5DE_09865 [Bacteroidota bacterium]|jgi:hypothetical protein
MPKKSEITLKDLEETIASLGITIEEAIERIKLIDSNPAVSFYRTIVSASKQLQDAIVDGTLDLSDKYQSSLLRMLEVGDKVAKTVTAAKLEAFPETDIPKSDEGGLGNRRRQ